MTRRSAAAIIELPDPAPQDPELLDDALTGKKRFENIFAIQLNSFPTLEFAQQLRFAKVLKRQWQFDFAFPKFKIAVEIEGLCVMARCPRCFPGQTFVGGGHATIQGLKKDMEKYNTAALLGWMVLRFQQKDVIPRHAIDMTLRVLAVRGWRAST